MAVAIVAEPLKPRMPEGKKCDSRSRPAHLVSLKKPAPTASSPTQEWLEERLTTEVLRQCRHHGIVICAPLQLKPPAGFEGLWCTIDTESTCETISQASVALMLCNPSDAQQLDLCLGVLRTITADTAPIFLVAHTVAPHSRTEVDEDAFMNAIAKVLCSGVDDVILGEPKGDALVQSVHSKCIVNARTIQRQEVLLARRQEQFEKFTKLHDGNHDALFNYLRLRLKIQLPDVDRSLNARQGCRFDGYKVGTLLGKGAFAEVFKLEHSTGKSCPTSQVLKVMKKSKIRCMNDVLQLDQHIQMMTLVSKDMYRHPNIVQMYQVYHTPTNICFRMEDAGSMHLCQRLLQREKNLRPLSTLKVKAILNQASDALVHLHSKLSIVHRDIKPENIIISEDEEDNVTIKLADFDMATNVDADSKVATELMGTFPFIAPELALASSARLSPTDVWSMGLTFLEVICGLRCLERTLQFGSLKGGRKETLERLTTISVFFDRPQAVQKMLKREAHPQMQELLGASGLILDGMLQMDPEKRWTVSEMEQAMPLLNEGVSCALAGNAGSLKRLQN